MIKSKKVALITGVSRIKGIGYTLAKTLINKGILVHATGWSKYDQITRFYEKNNCRISDVKKYFMENKNNSYYSEIDLEMKNSPGKIILDTINYFGKLDIVICCHARSINQNLSELTLDELDKAWFTNVRSTVMLCKLFNNNRTPGKGGRFIVFTSGQHIEPMANEIPYAISKGALLQMTKTMSDAVIDNGITVNCINPGPVDTGYVKQDQLEEIAQKFPAKRWGTPDDISKLVSWLVSKEAEWMTGQVIDYEGGFRRYHE
ncbi:MAG TPA: 3-ketoacyl-ACP reductase [Deltaproteobacteria bacterium]|jgi:3-oxoacyl-[acyl-carrier protein] reductase|nr:3-ketoacyl-ACP reductase [Deltaproteobacteria bacterium]|tara:strand:+ start:185 stop:967 length:783 start_codon:yes stop_codon:yes gene_type:complete